MESSVPFAFVHVCFAGLDVVLGLGRGQRVRCILGAGGRNFGLC